MEKENAVLEYIASFGDEAKTNLEKVREAILSVEPNFIEKISWGIPTYQLKKDIIHFGGFKNHIGLYPGPKAIHAFENQLNKYETAKGTIKFYYSQPIPFQLIKDITIYKIRAVLDKTS